MRRKKHHTALACLHAPSLPPATLSATSSTHPPTHCSPKIVTTPVEVDLYSTSYPPPMWSDGKVSCRLRCYCWCLPPPPPPQLLSTQLQLPPPSTAALPAGNAAPRGALPCSFPPALAARLRLSEFASPPPLPSLAGLQVRLPHHTKVPELRPALPRLQAQPLLLPLQPVRPRPLHLRWLLWRRWGLRRWYVAWLVWAARGAPAARPPTREGDLASFLPVISTRRCWGAPAKGRGGRARGQASCP